MKCKDFKKIISLYLDGFLPPAERAEAEKHIFVCGECKKEYTALKNIRSVLVGFKLPETSKKLDSAFTDSVMDKIKNNSVVVEPVKSGKTFYLNVIKKHFLIAAGFLFVISASAVFLVKDNTAHKEAVARNTAIIQQQISARKNLNNDFIYVLENYFNSCAEAEDDTSEEEYIISLLA